MHLLPPVCSQGKRDFGPWYGSARNHGSRGCVSVFSGIDSKATQKLFTGTRSTPHVLEEVTTHVCINYQYFLFKLK